MTRAKAVAAHFGRAWTDYEAQIRSVIPGYDLALDLLVAAAVEAGYDDGKGRIVELGIGTGNFAERLLLAFPQAAITGIDTVPELLNEARRKLSAAVDRVTLHVADATAFDLPHPLSIICSSFMIHHLEDADKLRLYQRSFRALAPGGLLLVADFVDSGSPLWSAVMDRLRVAAMRGAGMADEEITELNVEHRKLEIPTPMERQFAWLDEIGFADIDCVWKHLNLAAFVARRPA